MKAKGQNWDNDTGKSKMAKQVPSQMVHRCFQKAWFSSNKLTGNVIYVQELQESLSQCVYENVTTKDYLNIDTEDETEADGKEKIELPKNRLSANLAHTTML